MALLAVLVIGGTAHAQEMEAPPQASPRSQPDEAGEEPAATPGAVPWIQGQSVEERKRARALFLEANVLLADTLFARAAAKYEQAIAIWAHPAFFYNLALARIHLDQPIAAYESMRQAVRHGPAPLGEDLYQNAQNFLALLDGQLAEIEVVCDEPGAAVTLDGKPLFVGPGRRTLMALPGGHALMASKNGRLPDSEQIVLAPGQRARFTLAPQPPVYLATERRWAAWRPWTVTGVGLAIVAAGGVVDWRAGAAFDRHDREAGRLCASPAGCAAADIPAGLRRQLDRAERMQLGARITYAAGAAVLASGAVLLYLNRERPVQRRGRAGTVRVSVLPVLAPRAVGVGASVAF